LVAKAVERGTTAIHSWLFRVGEDVGMAALAEMIGNAVPPKLTYVVALELLR